MMKNSDRVRNMGAANPPDVRLVGATVATLAVLRLLASARGPLRLIDVAQPLGLNRSTAFNILRTLAHEGVATFDATAKTYVLTGFLADLARGLEAEPKDRILALHEAMSGVANLFKVNVAHWVMRGDRLVLVAVAESPAEVKLTQVLAQRVPLLYGAVGRAIAAESGMSDEEIERRFRETVWRWPQELEALKADVRVARRRGWGDDGGSGMPGTRAIAVALRNERDAVGGGCAALMFAGQHDAAGEAAIANALQQIARN